MLKHPTYIFKYQRTNLVILVFFSFLLLHDDDAILYQIQILLCGYSNDVTDGKQTDVDMSVVTSHQ